MGHLTVFIIAQRISSVRNADKIQMCIRDRLYGKPVAKKLLFGFVSAL